MDVDLRYEQQQQQQHQLVDHAYADYASINEDELRQLDEDPNAFLLLGNDDGRMTTAATANNATSGDDDDEQLSEESKERLRRGRMMMTMMMINSRGRSIGPMKKNAGGVVRPFPGKLLEVLDRSDLSDVIHWMPHGRAFLVRKPKIFASDVLPRFFKQTKFLSFTRQLNLWGFKRITRVGPDAGAYYHELFLRGRPYLVSWMRRQKIKGTGMKLTPNPGGEPNFYDDWPAVSPVPPKSSSSGEEGGGMPGMGAPLRPLPSLPSSSTAAVDVIDEDDGVGKGGATGVAKTTTRSRVVGGMGDGTTTVVAVGGGGGGCARADVASNADIDMLTALLRRESSSLVRPLEEADTAMLHALLRRGSEMYSDDALFKSAMLYHRGGNDGCGPMPSFLPGRQNNCGYGRHPRSAPRIGPYDNNLSIFSYLPSSLNNGGVFVHGNEMMGGGYNPNNDPNSASFFASTLIQGRGQQLNSAAAAANNSGLASGGDAGLSAVIDTVSSAGGGVVIEGMTYLQQQQQLSSDRLLMERLQEAGGRVVVEEMTYPQHQQQQLQLSSDRLLMERLWETGGSVVEGMTYPQHQHQQQQQLSSDRLLMERLRDLDKLQQVKRDGQDALRPKARSLAMAGALSWFGGGDGGSGVGIGRMGSAVAVAPSPARTAFEQKWKNLVKEKSILAANPSSGDRGL